MSDLPPGYSISCVHGSWFAVCPGKSPWADLDHASESAAADTAWLDYATRSDPAHWRAFRALCQRHAEIRRDNYGERCSGLGIAAVARALGRDARLVRRWCAGKTPIDPTAAQLLREIIERADEK